MVGRAVAWVFGLLVLLVAGAVGVVLLGVRHRYPPVVDAVRRFARDVGNPRLLKSAGRPGANAAILRHVGRTSGKSYETPVTAILTPGGFVIALPYGPTTDWLKNLTAAGSAALVHDGRTHVVDHPEVVPLHEAAQDFSPGERRMLRLFGVDECLRLHSVPSSSPR